MNESSTPAADEPGCADFATARDRANERRSRGWAFAAALAYLAATAALRWRAALPAPLPWLAVGTAALLTLVALRSYARYLHAADELVRRIQTEGLALGFGAGLVFSLLAPLLEKLGAPAKLSDATVVVMTLAWAFGTWRGMRRISKGGSG